MLKKCLAFLLLATASGAAIAEWSRIGTTESDAELYIDRATLSKSGATVKLWMMEDYPAPRTFSGKTFSSAKLQHEYDCKGSKRRLLQSELYSGRKGGGTTVLTSTKQTDWRAINPSTVAETMWKVACGRK